eukprot:12740614-Prorocentrum_lima.AAC.1
MTSSLVGSEMCIRDRIKLCMKICERDWKNLDEVFNVVVRGWMQGCEPVSYTHLTLPTICGV